MGAVIANLAGGMMDNPSAPALLTGTGSDDRHLVIVATADRGLCGAFNTNIVRLARQHIEQLLREGKKVKILCIGRKGRDLLRRRYPAARVQTRSLADLSCWLSLAAWGGGVGLYASTGPLTPRTSRVLSATS